MMRERRRRDKATNHAAYSAVHTIVPPQKPFVPFPRSDRAELT